jgi:cytochrome c oxidase cbb3-type subunit 3
LKHPGECVVLGLVLALASGCAPRGEAPVVRGATSALLAVRYDQHIAAGGIEPAGDTTLHNPFAGKAQLAEEGRKLFSSMNCDGCHSAGGEGWVAPSLNDNRWRYGGSDGAIFHSIYYGRPKGMPAFGGILVPDVVWRLVTYIRSLPGAKAVPTQSWE